MVPRCLKHKQIYKQTNKQINIFWYNVLILNIPKPGAGLEAVPDSPASAPDAPVSGSSSPEPVPNKMKE